MTGPDAPIRIDRLQRTVADLARSIAFYRDALGFAVAHRDGTAARLRLGEQEIELRLHDGRAPLPPGAIAPDPRFQHAAIVTADMEAAYRRLQAHGAVAISRGGPQILPAETGGVTAFKFRDPDGHPLELIRFPPGAGDPRWERATADGPTLGIDHFGLVVEKIDASVAFFIDRLGFRVASRGVNAGAAQDRLDGLEAVVVDVVALEPRAAGGPPHLELLGYRHPLSKRPDTAASEVGRDVIVCVAEQRASTALAPRRIHDPDCHVFQVGTPQQASTDPPHRHRGR